MVASTQERSGVQDRNRPNPMWKHRRQNTTHAEQPRRSRPSANSWKLGAIEEPAHVMARKWDECEKALDRAARADPDGDRGAEVKALRDAIAAGRPGSGSGDR
jgi:hypothetical protein